MRGLRVKHIKRTGATTNKFASRRVDRIECMNMIENMERMILDLPVLEA